MTANDFLYLCLGGGLAAIIHYLNMSVIAYRIKRMEHDIAKMFAEHAIKQASNDAN